MGGVWHDGSLYVASPPNIWRLNDTDDDGVADRREMIVTSFGYNGNAASIHGCFLGPDGRIYWCDGYHGHEFKDDDGQRHQQTRRIVHLFVSTGRFGRTDSLRRRDGQSGRSRFHRCGRHAGYRQHSLHAACASIAWCIGCTVVRTRIASECWAKSKSLVNCSDRLIDSVMSRSPE